MTTASDHIDTIISNAITTANTNTQKADDAAQDLINKSAGFYLVPPGHDAGFVVEAIEPDIPKATDTTATYETQLEKIIKLLSDELAKFFDKYYPLASDSFDEAQTWLVNAITNGGTGINPDIESQIWNRARNRIIAEGRRIESQIEIGYSSKGHFLLSGSMTKKIEESRFEQAKNSSEASVGIAAKQIDVEIETVKFAISMAIESRSMAMNSAADYIRAVATAPANAASVASLNSDVQAKMMQAAATFYRARLDRDNLVLQSKLAEMNTDVDIYKHRRDNATKNDQVEISALASAADVFGRSASASLSSLNSIASTATNAFS